MSRKTSGKSLETDIVGISHDGRGVGDYNEHVVFIENALPGERVKYFLGGKRRKTYNGQLSEIIKASPNRIEPACKYFGVCGGCALQHLDLVSQLELKHQQLVDSLQRIAKVKPEKYLEPQVAAAWNYRRKARLGVRFVPKKGGVLVGFRERHKSYITSLDECLVLDQGLSTLLKPLHKLITELSCFDHIPQIEVASADNAIALVFRHLQELTTEDQEKLKEFGARYDSHILLQPEGLDSIHQIYPSDGSKQSLYYHVDGLRLKFHPTDFIQVNAKANQKLVSSALSLLEPQARDSVLDLFCGLGNFTLPIAKMVDRVLGLEADEHLVKRAAANAMSNGIANAEFNSINLYDEQLSDNWMAADYNKILLDPPRSGALEVVKRITKINPERIVYVSCNPATLARDTSILVNQFNYRVQSAGVIDMFPHTPHVESIALFLKN